MPFTNRWRSSGSNPEGIASFSPALDDAVGLRWVSLQRPPTPKELNPLGVRQIQLLRSRADYMGLSQGSSFLATLGWMMQSLRDCLSELRKALALKR
jgi:hypothetical protein